MSKFMMTCKEASTLMSQSFDRRLGLLEKSGLRMHLMICKGCQVAYRQLDSLHRYCRKIAAEPEDILSAQPGLSQEAKERILKELHRKQDSEL